MASRRSSIFDNVDPELARSIEAAAASYKKHRVTPRSGYRKGSKGFHGKDTGALAMDVWLEDLLTGEQLDSYQGGGAIKPYQDFANYWYGTLTPEQQQRARWGGYFGDPTKPEYGKKYGEQDYMHFDFGRSPGVGMLAGDWKTGFNADAMKRLGLTEAGGAEIAAQMSAAGYSPEQIKKAFLDTIASTEANSYDVMYGGEKFTDFSKHPGRSMPILDDQGNVTGHSSAAGRYQFIGSTWDEQAKKYGYKDFSPETQDIAAWNYASDIFKQKGGGDLMEALSSNDPARQNAAAQILNQTWTSLPGGPEQAKGYGDQTFADVFAESLGAPSPASPGTGGGGGGTGTGGGTTSTTEKKKNPWEAAGEYLSESSGMGGYQPTTLPELPKAALFQSQSTSVGDPQELDMRKRRLAEIMAALAGGSKTVVV